MGLTHEELAIASRRRWGFRSLRDSGDPAGGKTDGYQIRGSKFCFEVSSCQGLCLCRRTPAGVGVFRPSRTEWSITGVVGDLIMALISTYQGLLRLRQQINAGWCLLSRRGARDPAKYRLKMETS